MFVRHVGELAEAARLALAEHGRTERSGSVAQKKEKTRVAIKESSKLVALLCQADPDASILWRTMPIDNSTVMTDGAFRVMARVRLGLPPVAWIKNCPAKHKGVALKNMKFNKAYDLNPRHWLACGTLLQHVHQATRLPGDGVPE